MAVQTLKRLAITFILIVIFLGASQHAPLPYYTNTNAKMATVWVVVEGEKGRTYMKVTMECKTLQEKYTWCGYYKNMDIYIRRNK